MPLTVSCDFCDDDVEKYPYQLEGKENVFCDRECHRQFQIAQPPEEHNSYQGGKISVDCTYCGKENVKEVWPKRIRNQNNFFCDMKCLGKFNENRYAGEGNPNFKGGDWEHNYRGANWASIRNSVRERDNYKCQDCGATAEELGQIPDCHHIIPEHTFENRTDAHYEDNLILLCRDCHNEIDGTPPDEQRQALGL